MVLVEEGAQHTQGLHKHVWHEREGAVGAHVCLWICT